MDIKLLEDILCLANQESFTVAARERNITQSALSRRIKSLEDWLGTPLVDRDAKSFSLTPQGRVFIPEAEIILRRLYNSREAVRALSNSGEIAVAAQNSIAQTLFLDWVKELESKSGQVYVRLISEKLSDCIELLYQGHVDYLFCYANDTLTLPIDRHKFAYTTIGREALIPVTAADDAAQPRYRLPGSAEHPVPFIAYAHNSTFGRAVDQLIQEKRDRCFLARHYDNPYAHTLQSMTREGMGLAWLPESAILEDLANGKLCRAGDESWDIEFDIRLYYHHAAHSYRETIIQELSQAMARDR